MIKKSERVLVGLSGGADSVSLLLCLKELGFNVSACHINHQLRGKESDRDEEFCIDLCKKYNIEIFVNKIDVKKYCEQNSYSIEEGARNLRYNIFNNIECDKIATAHSLSDCLETTIFNLARGTGLKGLCSIPAVRGNIIRPLIECTRDEIEEYLKSKNQKFVIDSTNLSDDYSRNKIRHIIVPAMSEINTSLFSTFKSTLDNLKSDESYFEEQVDNLFIKIKRDNGFDSKLLSSAHTAIRNRCIAKILSSYNLPYNNKNINLISSILTNGGKINIHQNIFALCKNDVLYITEIKQNNNFQYCKEIDFSKIYQFGKKNISFNIKEYDKNEIINKWFTNCCLDYDKIIGKVWLRNRKSGDKIKLCNRNFTSSVKKLFNEYIPKEQRDNTVILEDEMGIIFIENFGCADRVKIDDETQHILIFKVS